MGDRKGIGMGYEDEDREGKNKRTDILANLLHFLDHGRALVG